MPTDYDIPDQQPKKKVAEPGTPRRTPWLRIVAFVTLFFFAMTWFVAVNTNPEGGPPQIQIAQNEAEAGLFSNLLMAIPLAVFNFFCKMLYDILVKPLLTIIKAIFDAIKAIFEIFAEIKKMMRALDEFFCSEEEAETEGCTPFDLGREISDGVDHMKEEMGEAYDDALVASDLAIGRMRQSAKGCMSKFLNIGNAVGSLGAGASLSDVDDEAELNACLQKDLMRKECNAECGKTRDTCVDRCPRTDFDVFSRCETNCENEKVSCDRRCGPEQDCRAVCLSQCASKPAGGERQACETACSAGASLNHNGPAGLDMIMSGQFLAGVYGQGPTPDELLASADQRGPKPPPCADLEALNNITAEDVLELAYLYHHDKLDVIPEKFIALVPSYYLETVNFMVGSGEGFGSGLIDAAEGANHAITSKVENPIDLALAMCDLLPFVGGCPLADVANSMTTASSQFQWMEETFWNQIVQPKLKDMAAQLSAVAFKQVEMIGRFFDAQIAIDAQRSLQELMAISARDYTPSEAVCRFGTAAQSLAASDHKSSVTQIALSEWAVARQMRRKGVSDQEDLTNRWNDLKTKFCDRQDYAGQASGCTSTNRELLNRDINFTNTIDSRLTLELNAMEGAETPDSKSLFALARNLYGNEPNQGISDPDTNMKVRALVAKRSVAMNSFNAIAAQRAPGTSQSKEALKAILQELGFAGPDQEELLTGIGGHPTATSPSYYAQMEVLTKKIYQNPNFYVNLMDKPANVQRQQAAMQGFGLMQQRDMYNSLLRSEMLLSVLLEMEIERAQRNLGGGIQ